MGKLIFIDQWLSERRMEEIITGSVQPLPTRVEMERFDPRQQQRLSFGTFQNCHKRQGIAYQRKGPCGFSFRIFLFCFAWSIYFWCLSKLYSNIHVGPFTLYNFYTTGKTLKKLSELDNYFFILRVWIVHMGHLSLLCRALKRGQSCDQMPEYFTGVLRVSVYLKNKSGVSGPELTTKKKKTPEVVFWFRVFQSCLWPPECD